jgi:hypothetical protein
MVWAVEDKILPPASLITNNDNYNIESYHAAQYYRGLIGGKGWYVVQVCKLLPIMVTYVNIIIIITI